MISGQQALILHRAAGPQLKTIPHIPPLEAGSQSSFLHGERSVGRIDLRSLVMTYQPNLACLIKPPFSGGWP